jgi:hypothetical protein
MNMPKPLDLDIPEAHSPLELALAQALEHIEYILNQRSGAFVNEDETTRQIRGIINSALKKTGVTADLRRLSRAKVNN